jgi:hypothetical protein
LAYTGRRKRNELGSLTKLDKKVKRIGERGSVCGKGRGGKARRVVRKGVTLRTVSLVDTTTLCGVGFGGTQRHRFDVFVRVDNYLDVHRGSN